jgi:uncharacterized protein (TIGR02246 family)
MIRMITSCMLAVWLVSPTLAQERGLSDEAARKVADTITTKYESAFNAADAASLSELYSQDATYLPALGPVLTGRLAIRDGAAARFQSSKSKVTEKILEARSAGDAVWTTGEWTLAAADGKEFRGHYAYVLVQDGKDWRIRMAISNLTPPK